MSARWSRRSFIGSAAAATTGTFLGAAFLGQTTAAADPWRDADAIARSVCPPRFPRRHFPVTRFGAKGDGVTDCTRAFAGAVHACTRAGGGHVIVPPGRYLTGPIHLKNNVDLHVAEGATIAFGQD